MLLLTLLQQKCSWTIISMNIKPVKFIFMRSHFQRITFIFVQLFERFIRKISRLYNLVSYPLQLADYYLTSADGILKEGERTLLYKRYNFMKNDPGKLKYLL